MNVTETFSLAVRFILREKLKFTYMQDSINEGDIVMKFAEFLEEMKVKYSRQRDQQEKGAGSRKVFNVFKEWEEVKGGWDIVCVCVCVCVCL